MTEPTAEEIAQHEQRCRRGWLSPWHAEHPVPCLVCKPHLRRTLDDPDARR